MISYLRLSVTDRCDLRCRYCMSENMTFLPKAEVLSIDELGRIAEAFIARGVRRIRLTGGEPLVRRDVDVLARRIGGHLATGALEELTLTTNGIGLDRLAPVLRNAGVRRVNVSLDNRRPDRFRRVTRVGDVARVLAGIDAAAEAGLAIKINMVALEGVNDDEFGDMLRWCADRGFDLTLIETMPLGTVEEDQADRFVPLDGVRRRLEAEFDLEPVADRTGGPARYLRLAGTSTRLGLIAPLTGNFCDGCNRMRVTASGKLVACLGHDEGADLRGALREGGPAALDAAIDAALATKPRRHEFGAAMRAGAPAIARHMSVTGG